MAELGQRTGAFQEPEVSEEGLLLSRLKRIEANPSGVYAVHLYLSKLRPSNRKPHFMKIAARAFDFLAENHEATVFPMHNADLILICRNVPVDDADAAVDKVRALFGEDPLITSGEGAFEDDFSTWFDLSQPEEFSTFVAAANELAIEAQRQQKLKSETKVQENKQQGEPLGAMNLADINQKLQGTRVADLIRNQTCLLMGAGGPGGIVFREYFVSMADLKKRIAPDVNLFSSPWLFQYLTETLDKRVLAVLGNRDIEGMSSPVSLNLNVGTILSRDFQKFHAAVGKGAKNVVVEIQVIDIFADMNTYGYARDSLQERGYRVVVDGLSPLALQFIDPGLLKSDFVKISWGSEFEGDVDSTRTAQMRDVVSAMGKDNVILSRVDTEEAMKWGFGLGVSRFQGFFVDDMMVKLNDIKAQQAKAKAKLVAAAPPAAPVAVARQAAPAPAQPARPVAPPTAPAAPVAVARPAAPAQPVAQPTARPPAPAPAPAPAQPAAQPVARPSAPPAPVRPQPAARPPAPPTPAPAQAIPVQPKPVSPGTPPGAPPGTPPGRPPGTPKA